MYTADVNIETSIKRIAISRSNTREPMISKDSETDNIATAPAKVTGVDSKEIWVSLEGDWLFVSDTDRLSEPGYKKPSQIDQDDKYRL